MAAREKTYDLNFSNWVAASNSLISIPESNLFSNQLKYLTKATPSLLWLSLNPSSSTEFLIAFSAVIGERWEGMTEVLGMERERAVESETRGGSNTSSCTLFANAISQEPTTLAERIDVHRRQVSLWAQNRIEIKHRKVRSTSSASLGLRTLSGVLGRDR